MSERRETGVERLGALQAALWPMAMRGDVDAVMACRKIIESRCRLLGLYEGRSAKKPMCTQPQTVVLLEDDCRQRGCPDHTSAQGHSTASFGRAYQAGRAVRPRDQ